MAQPTAASASSPWQRVDGHFDGSASAATAPQQQHAAASSGEQQWPSSGRSTRMMIIRLRLCLRVHRVPLPAAGRPAVDGAHDGEVLGRGKAQADAVVPGSDPATAPAFRSRIPTPTPTPRWAAAVAASARRRCRKKPWRTAIASARSRNAAAARTGSSGGDGAQARTRRRRPRRRSARPACVVFRCSARGRGGEGSHYTSRMQEEPSPRYQLG